MQMSPKLRPIEFEPIGSRITGFEVHGEELDSQLNWVGADLIVKVEGLGRYLVHVVTKDQFAVEALENAYTDLAQPEKLLDTETTEVRPPFVVNDRALDLDILVTKFGDRVVAEDLAETMFYLPETS